MRRDKRGISLMVSYVLLIVIALSMAISVYAWLKFYAPQEPKETCPAEVALWVKDYSCNNESNILTIEIENKGLFSIDGFFIKGTNETHADAQPIYPLNATESSRPPNTPKIAGRYYFASYDPNGNKINAFKPASESRKISFYYNASYENLGVNLTNLTKIQIQPYIESEDYLLLCENIFNLKMSKAKNCN